MTDTLARLEGAVAALAHVQTAREAREGRDVAAALAVWAKKAGLGLEAQNHAAEIKIRTDEESGSAPGAGSGFRR